MAQPLHDPKDHLVLEVSRVDGQRWSGGYGGDRGPGLGFPGNDFCAPAEHERISVAVLEAIAKQGHIDASDIEVKVDGGIVTLTGTVADPEQRRLLEELARRCHGVEHVHNELQPERTGDATLAARS